MRLPALLLSIFISLMVSAQTDTVVSFVTAYPGEEIYELEGHSALRVNMGYGRDYAVSYGVFDFNSPGFVYRFVKGETDYMVALLPWEAFQDSYRQQGRRLVEHPIEMTSAQCQRLLQLLGENLLPQNRVYRYNYVKDNCATRPLNILQRAMGDSIILGDSHWHDADVTFRDVMRYYHRNYPWYQFGIDLALGSGIDYPINNRELAFAPVVLDEQLPQANVAGHRLTGEPKVLIDVAADNAVCGPTPWWLSPLAVCWAVFVLLAVATIYDLRRRRVTRWVDAVYYGIMGLAGCLIAFLIFVSVHEATSPNWLFVWLNPLCLIPAIFIWLKNCKKLVLSYQIANFVALFLLSALWGFLPQTANAAFLPLILGDAMRAASYIILNRKE